MCSKGQFNTGDVPTVYNRFINLNFNDCFSLGPIPADVLGVWAFNKHYQGVC